MENAADVRADVDATTWSLLESGAERGTAGMPIVEITGATGSPRVLVGRVECAARATGVAAPAGSAAAAKVPPPAKVIRARAALGARVPLGNANTGMPRIAAHSKGRGIFSRRIVLLMGIELLVLSQYGGCKRR
jgi:hypothetical protein